MIALAVHDMSNQKMPSSFYMILVSFAVFFVCINIYILTKLLSHPLASELWLIGVAIGSVLLLYSIRMVKIQQKEMIAKKESEPQSND